MHLAVRRLTDDLDVCARLGHVGDAWILGVYEKVFTKKLVILYGGIVLDGLKRVAEMASVILGSLSEGERIDGAQLEVFVPHEDVEMLVDEADVAVRVSYDYDVIHESEHVYGRGLKLEELVSFFVTHTCVAPFLNENLMYNDFQIF